MMDLDLNDVVSATGGRLFSPARVSVLRGFSIDSRSIVPGNVFIAVKGNNFDGHDFIKEAVSGGACLVIAERVPSGHEFTERTPFILVEDSINAMGKVAGLIRKSFGGKVVCVTGTNGKTTVKDVTAGTLSGRYRVLKSKASYNNIFGLCLTLFEMNSSHEAAVLEVGTNHFGEIGHLASIASADIAVITNIGFGHLESFGDRRGVFSEKISLLDKLRDGGTALLNGDDDMLSSVRSDKHRIIFYGTGDNCEMRLEDIRSVPGGVEFKLNGEKLFFNGEGRHNAYNAAAAVSVAVQMGISVKAAGEEIRKLSLPSMRLEKTVTGGITFLNDAYNANPSSFEAAVETLSGVDRGKSEKWVVAGDMRELGDLSSEMHRAVGRKIADLKINFLVAMGEMGREILKGAVENGMDKRNTHEAVSHEDAARWIKEKASSGATVLVKGSRLMKMEEVIKCFTISCTR